MIHMSIKNAGIQQEKERCISILTVFPLECILSMYKTCNHAATFAELMFCKSKTDKTRPVGICFVLFCF